MRGSEGVVPRDAPVTIATFPSNGGLYPDILLSSVSEMSFE